MKRVHLRVMLPKNRDNIGHLRVEVNGTPVADFRVLARGSRGPGDTALQTNGNTPTGTYSGNQIIDTATFPQSSYGPWGAVRLQPIAGDALLAEAIGRRGLLIHGGNPATSGPWKGSLKPTQGCLRVCNDDMQKLRTLLEKARTDGRSCLVTDITVTVSEWP
jgi:hypothetical protein